MSKKDIKVDAYDCFAYSKGECRVLTSEKCEGESCAFYKTKEQLAKGRKKARQRILSLDRDRRRYIVNCYYKGKDSLLEREK